MSDQHHDDTVVITLELPAELTAQLENLREEFGEKLVVDLVHKAIATIQGKLAPRGGLLQRDRK